MNIGHPYVVWIQVGVSHESRLAKVGHNIGWKNFRGIKRTRSSFKSSEEQQDQVDSGEHGGP